MPTFRKDIKLGTKVPLIKTDDLSDKAITTDKLADGSVTNPKLAPESVTQDKFDKELLAIFKAAANLPEDLIQTIQDVDATLKDHQQQITSNDEDISDLQVKVKQNKDTIDGIAVSGGASVASAVTYDNTISGLESENVQNAIDELVNNLGHYETNEEWLRLYLDKEGHILWGIRVDGSIEWSVGIPTPIQKKLNELITSDDTIKQTISELREYTNQQLDTKVDKEEGKSLIDDEVKDCFKIVENDEFIHCILDAEEHILFAIRRDTGKPYFPLNEMYHVEQNEEYFALWLDSADHILMGIRRDGVIVGEINACNVLKKVIENIQSDVAELQSIEPSLKELLNTFTFQENDEFLAVETDAQGKVLSATNADGSHYIHNAKSETIPTEFSHIDDPEERMEITMDADDRILDYRDKDGVKHEHEADVETLHVSNLDLKNNSVNDIQSALIANGFNVRTPVDWSNYSSDNGNSPLMLPMPQCAKVNLITDVDLTKLGKITTGGKRGTNYDVPTIIEFWDMQGNYFRKNALIGGQGRSSMAMLKKNIAIDLFDGDTGGDAFSVKFGNWVPQDSFHLKGYYTDTFKGVNVVAYQLMDEVMMSRGVENDRPYKQHLLQSSFTKSTVSQSLNSEARCIPDGFPVAVYQNNVFYGLFVWQLKKHRDNYAQVKDETSHIQVDSATIFNFNISWMNNYEIRNPKYLVRAAYNSNTELFGDSGFEYNGDYPCEIAGNSAADEWNEDSTYNINDIVKSGERYFISKVSENIGNKPIVVTTPKNVFNTKKSKDAYWIDITYTTTVKQHLINASKILGSIMSASSDTEKKTLIEKFFDVDNLIDYIILIEALNNVDGIGNNWQWVTYDGTKWYVFLYDSDLVFGGDVAAFTIWEPWEGHVTSSIIDQYQITKYIYDLYSEQINQRYKELVELGILSAEHIKKKINDWVKRIGNLLYSMEYKKWTESPCWRESNINLEYWKEADKWKGLIYSWNKGNNNIGNLVSYNGRIYECIKYAHAENLPTNTEYWKDITYTSGKSYSKGDYAAMYVSSTNEGRLFTCVKDIADGNIQFPCDISKYSNFPRLGGYHDSIYRIFKWIDKKYIYLNKLFNFNIS